MSPTSTHPAHAWRRALGGLALALTTTAGLAACSSGGGTDLGVSSAEVASSGGADLATDRERAVGDGRARPAAAVGDQLDEKVVSHGTVVLEADDVAQARAEVQRIVDTFAGDVAQSQTETDEDGDVVRSRMVARVPVTDFGAAMDRLEEVADLRSSDQASDVVTAKYTDLTARVRAQRAGLRRVELLFSRAETIRDIMAIEAQLTSRQADLDSLTGQLRVLDDRTSLSTITVHVERTPDAEGSDDDGAGFLPGLGSGWEALKAVGVALATVAGAVLPFTVALALLGVPLWLVVRRLRRHPAPGSPAATSPAVTSPAVPSPGRGAGADD